MQTPVRVTFQGMPVSDAVEAAAWKHAEELEQFFPRITGCHVVIATPHRHHHRGTLYSVRVDMTVPGGEIVVNREHRMSHAHEDVFVAMRDAFHAARRQLEDYARLLRGQVKVHGQPGHGRITALFPEQDRGVIETPDRREIYFHRKSVLADGFAGLSVGDQVRFVEEQGEKGPSATSVRPVGRHHHLPN